MIVDGEAQPELLQQLQEGNLNQFICENCGERSVVVDKPLLIYRPQQEPPLIFSPPLKVGPQQERALKHRLIECLVESIGGDDDWVMEGMKRVGRSELTETLKTQTLKISLERETANQLLKSKSPNSKVTPASPLENQRDTLDRNMQGLPVYLRQALIELSRGAKGPADFHRLLNDYPELKQIFIDMMQGLPVHLRQTLIELSKEAKGLEDFDQSLNDYPELKQMFTGVMRENRGHSSELQGILDELGQPIRDMRKMGRRIELCQQALTLVTRQNDARLWATLQNNLGCYLVQNLQVNQVENLEKAIDAHKQALQVNTRDAMPVEWAESMMNLANA